MIIKRMQATFGKLDRRELKLQPGLNVITGANEAGKSTWLAFILAMLYGVDTRDRVKAGRLPDKLKFQPWSGKPMEGSMELESGGKAITLERASSAAPMGDFRAWDSETGSPREDLSAKTCGQTLLGVEAGVYARSGFLRQQRISISADAMLEKRLSGLVTAGSEDYAFADIEEGLKKLQGSLRNSQGGAIARAEKERKAIGNRLEDIRQRQRELNELDAELRELKAQREDCRGILAGLDALDRQARQDRVTEAEAALKDAAEDREAWEGVCAGLPDEEALQALEHELQQLQGDLEKTALEEGLSVSELELPAPDPIFGRMDAREAHDKAAADATVVRDARNAKRPRRSRTVFWLLLILAGLGLGFAGALQMQLPIVVGGVVLAVVGLLWWLLRRIQYNRRKDAYIAMQKQARDILEQYSAASAKDVVLRGIAYIRTIETREDEEADQDEERRALMTELADRRADIYRRLEALMPGSGTPEKAAALFQESAASRQALTRARALEQERTTQLLNLRFALGSEEEPEADAERFANYNRADEMARLQELETRIEALSSQADKLTGAIGQMGDPLALEAERAILDRELRKMEERYASLRLARRALAEADENLRARFAPILCEKTGAIFCKLTGGKYDKVQLDRQFRVTVHPVDSPVFRPLSYLSSGTVDQLYLALRLAISELLIPEAPIVLDDALVYFDDRRAALALETLREMSKTRQVLIFTCQSREKRILDELARKRKAAEAAEIAAAAKAEAAARAAEAAAAAKAAQEAAAAQAAAAARAAEALAAARAAEAAAVSGEEAGA